MLGGSGWVKYYIELKNKKKNENELLVTEYLAQIETRLKSNRDIKNRIYEKYREASWGILESYVKKVNKGEDKRGIILLPSDISTIEQNNKEVIRLLTEYSGYSLSSEFEQASSKYIKYAQNWVNRASAISIRRAFS